MALVVSVLFLIVVFALIAYLLTIYMRRVTDVALTDKFREAETIVNGRIPDKWVVQINRRLAANWLMRIFQRDRSGTELALRRIDKLIRFFENGPFFEDAEARELLLGQLQETRERWSKMTWEELA